MVWGFNTTLEPVCYELLDVNWYLNCYLYYDFKINNIT